MFTALQGLIRRFGFDLVRYDPARPWTEIKKRLTTASPVCFDVGANVGQTVFELRSTFPECVVHSFEASPGTFGMLKLKVSGLPEVYPHNLALGAKPGHGILLENTRPCMSSFLAPGKDAWGEVRKQTSVPMSTVDRFCSEHGIDRIDILKSDTQGYELEVFKGATEAFRDGRIGSVFFEVIFSDMYIGAPSFGSTFEFLTSRDFVLISFYKMRYQEGRAGWADALFVHRSLI